MPVLVAALVVILVAVLGAVVLVPLAIVLRYRAGTARRRARPWLAGVNAAGLALSALLFLAGAAITNVWVPQAFGYAAAGLVAGSLLGVAGLLVTRWEPAPGALYYTPNRWLVLAITVAVAGRLAYGVWRGWQAWGASGDASWAAAAGAAESLAAGAVVIGYYFAYWTGVRRRAQTGLRTNG